MVAADSSPRDFRGFGSAPRLSQATGFQREATNLNVFSHGLQNLGQALINAALINHNQLDLALEANSGTAFDASATQEFLINRMVSVLAEASKLSQRTVRFFAQRIVFKTASFSSQLIGTTLLEAGLLKKHQIRELVYLQRYSPKKRLGELAVEKGWIRAQTLKYLLRSLYPNARTSSLPIHPSVGNSWKRALDLIGASVGLIIVGLLFIPIAIAIKRDSPGPILYSQVRCGLRGKPFRMWKFRSMCQEADSLKSVLTSEVEGQIFKQTNDPRITRIGKLLRRTSLDELPQFWNVLIGDMSLVGTRPPTPNESQTYQDWHWRRLDVKPGLTGEWQVSGRSSIKNFDDVVRLDLRYQQRWSLLYDLQLLCRTILVVLTRKGAY